MTEPNFHNVSEDELAAAGLTPDEIFLEFAKRLQNGEGVRAFDHESNGVWRACIGKYTTGTINQLADNGQLHICTLIDRPNAQKFIHELETLHYLPCTPANYLFTMTCFLWEDMRWLIVGIPLKDKPLAATIAARHNLRFTEGGCETLVIGTPDPTVTRLNHPAGRFPLFGDNVVFLQTK